MTEERFDKDAWIKLALVRGHLNCDKLGNIYVRRKDTWKKLKSRVHKKSGRVYLNITFMGKTKSVLVNRVVALKYLPNPDGKAEVNHIDGNKENNHVSNLEWANRSEQEKHAFREGLKSTRGSQNSNAKLSASDVVEMRKRYMAGEGFSELATAYGVSQSTVRGIIRGSTWSHL